MAKLDNEIAARAAIDRILNGQAERIADRRLVDINLILESGLKRATLYRCDKAMFRWREAKAAAVAVAIEHLRTEQSIRPDRSFTDADLVVQAGIDYAALRRIPENLLALWEEVKANSPGRARRKLESQSTDQLIQSLVNKLYAATLAIRRRDELLVARDRIIEAQAATIERLGGNVVRLVPPDDAPRGKDN